MALIRFRVAAGEACVRLRSSRESGLHEAFDRVVVSDFTAAAQPDAGFASCYIGDLLREKPCLLR